MASSTMFRAAMAMADVADTEANTTWTGVEYSGFCWRVHSMSALPLPGVGLANTLFGLLAGLTFCIILHTVYTGNHRARTRMEQDSIKEGSSPLSAASDNSSNHRVRSASAPSSFLATSFASLAGATEENGGQVAFSSYVKFLNASCFWALLWVIFNLFPQVSSGRDLPTLWWHAVVASLVYTASVFLEMAVVVFIVNGGVGQKAFRLAAIICGIVSVIYGSLNLYFRLAWDIPPAHDDPLYPIGQLDFISSRPTIIFLIVSSAMFAIFFLSTTVMVLRTSPKDVANTSSRRKRMYSAKSASISAAASAVTSPNREAEGLLGAQQKSYGGAGAVVASSAMKDAAAPLIGSQGQPTQVVMISPAYAGYQSENESIVGTSPTEVRVSVVDAAPTRSISPAQPSNDDLADAAAAMLDSRSPSPQPFAYGNGAGANGNNNKNGSVQQPKRHSVVLYSIFLAFYYTLKTTGLILLYVEQDAGICCLDGGILLYMLVYAFLLYWTLVSDSRYWHNLLATAEVRFHHAPHESGKRDPDHPAQTILLTENSGLATPKGGRASSPNPMGAAGLKSSSFKRDRASSRGRWEGEDRLDESGLISSSSFTRKPNARSGSVMLRDYIIPPNQIVQLRTLVIAESSPKRASTPGGGGVAGSGSGTSRGGSSRRGPRESPIPTPTLSRSSSGSGAAALGLTATTKWSLSTMSSRVNASLRIVTQGWADRTCTLFLAKKGNQLVAVKQFSLPSITADFFRRDFQSFISLVPMGLWLANPAIVHDNLAQVLGISVDPPCVSIVCEYGSAGTLYDILHPNTASSATATSTSASSAAIPIPGTSSNSFHYANGGAASNGSSSFMAPIAASNSHSGDTPLSPGSGSGGGMNAHHYQALTGDSSSSASFPRPQRSPSTTSLPSGPALLPFLNVPRIAKQLASAMAQLHRWTAYDSHPLHLTPANIMLTENLDVKVADFADASLDGTVTHHHHSSSTKYKRPLISSPAWAAPEVLAGGNTSKQSGVYSFAIILWGLLTWKYPLVLVPAEDLLPHRHPLNQQQREASRSSPSQSYSYSASSSASHSYSHTPSQYVSPPTARHSSILKLSHPSSSSPNAIVSHSNAASILKPVSITNNASAGGRTVPASTSTSPPLLMPVPSGNILALPASSSNATASSSSADSSRPPSPSAHDLDEDGLGGGGAADDDAADDLTPADLARKRAAAAAAAAAARAEDELDSEGEGDEEGPPPIRYQAVMLSDLKLCQRFIMSENVRPPIPIGCPPSIGRLLELCWDENPDDRPSFEMIEEYLQTHCEEALQALQLPLTLPQTNMQHAYDGHHY